MLKSITVNSTPRWQHCIAQDTRGTKVCVSRLKYTRWGAVGSLWAEVKHPTQLSGLCGSEMQGGRGYVCVWAHNAVRYPKPFHFFPNIGRSVMGNVTSLSQLGVIRGNMREIDGRQPGTEGVEEEQEEENGGEEEGTVREEGTVGTEGQNKVRKSENRE